MQVLAQFLMSVLSQILQIKNSYNKFKFDIVQIGLMNCSACKKRYQTTNLQTKKTLQQSKPKQQKLMRTFRRVPRILTTCGHTLCQECIQNQLIKLKVSSNYQFKCYQCGKVNYGANINDFPINATLLQFLQQSQQRKQSYEKIDLKASKREGANKMQKRDDTTACPIHKLKFEAYCEKDKQLLCINCILNGNNHKSHSNKVLPISQVVLKDRKSLKQLCEERIQQGKQQLATALNKIADLQDRVEQQYKDYLFQVSLFYKSVRNEIQQCQHSALQRGKRMKQSICNKLGQKLQQVKDRKKFIFSVESIYQEVINPQLSDIYYLVEMQNKRNFVKQNCKVQKTRVGCPHLLFNKLTQYQDLISLFQNYVSAEKKNVLSVSGTLTKDLDIKQYLNGSKQKQNPRSSFGSQNRQKQSKIAIGSANRHSNNSSLNINMNKLKKKTKQCQKIPLQQPTVLQVNLVQRYQKHYSSRSSKRTSEKDNDNLANNKQKNSETRTKQINLTRHQSNSENQIGSPDFNFKKLKSNESPPLDRQFKEQQQDASIINNYQNLDFSYTTARGNQKSFQAQNWNLTGNSFDDQKFMQYPHKQQNINQNIPRFSTVSSIQSFMDQSHSSLLSSLKDSQGDFTLITSNQKIYHFGGFNDNPIECTKIDHFNFNKQDFLERPSTFDQIISRNKSQCVIYNSYSNSKCLILGGIDHKTDEMLSSIIQFDFKTFKIAKSPLYLSQQKCGFGVVCKDGKMFIFGGKAEQQKQNKQRETTNASAVATFQEYSIGNCGLQVRRLQKMHYARQQHGYALGLDGYIYSCGGISTNGSVLITCQRYSFGHRRWQPVPNMHHPRRSFTLLAVPSGLIAIGGHNGKKYLKSAEKYSYKEARWIQLKQMSVQRCAHSAVVSPDYQEIWVFGGFGRTQTSAREYSDLYQPLDGIQIYSVIEDEWKTQGKLKQKRFLHCSILAS